MIENSQFSITILLIVALIRFPLIGTHFALCPTLNGKVREPCGTNCKLEPSKNTLDGASFIPLRLFVLAFSSGILPKRFGSTAKR